MFNTITRLPYLPSLSRIVIVVEFGLSITGRGSALITELTSRLSSSTMKEWLLSKAGSSSIVITAQDIFIIGRDPTPKVITRGTEGSVTSTPISVV